MTLRIWEAAVGASAALLAAVFLLGGEPIIGAALLLSDAVWLVTRVSVKAVLSEPGRHSRMRGRLGLVKLLLVLGIYAAVGVAAFSVSEERPGHAKTFASFALAGLAFMLLRELQEAGDAALNWLIGGRAEVSVGKKLALLSDRGWLVLHGVVKDRGGDIDHVVCGPGGAFAIETKSYRFRRSDIGQAAGNAAWLKETLGVRWATGVLCVPEERKPSKNGVIWVMGQNELVPWLERQSEQGVDPALARAVLTAQT